MAHAAWHSHPALHKLSEEWSFCIGDGARPGFPFVALSPGFERLTLYSRKQLLGKNCGDALHSQHCNPPWLLDRVREAVSCVASGRTEWADFLVINRRANRTCFPNYVRVTMLKSLTGDNDPVTSKMMLGFQFDASSTLEETFHIEKRYLTVLSQVRNQLDWPAGLGAAGTRQQLAGFVKFAAEDSADSATSETTEAENTTAPFGSRRWRSASPPRSGCGTARSLADTASTRSQTWPGARPGSKAKPAPEDSLHEPSLRVAPSLPEQAAAPSERSALFKASRGRYPSPSLASFGGCTAETASVFAGCQCRNCRPGRTKVAEPQPASTIYVIEYRHTTGAFQPRLLGMPALADCVEPRHIQGGPVLFITDAARHAEVLALAARSARFFPRHVIVEAALVEVVTEEAEGIKAGRGRKVNEKSRKILED